MISVVLITAACSADPEPVAAPSPPSDGQLLIGALLPRTGDATHLRPSQLAGIRLAVADVNSAGGVLGQRIRVVEADIGDRRNGVAAASAEALLTSRVDSVILGGSSAVTADLLPRLAPARVLALSASNTAGELGGIPDNGLFFRTAPPDRLQGAALGDLVVQDENTSLRVLATDDPYGRTLADAVNRAAQAGGVDVAPPLLVARDGRDIVAAVGRVAEVNPDAVAVLASSRGQEALSALSAAGLDGKTKRLYLSDALLAPYPALPPGSLQGAQALRPGYPPNARQRGDLAAQVEEMAEPFYALEAYDAVVLTALAAAAARSDDGPVMAGKLRDLTRGGTACRRFDECNGLLTADPNADIQYEGLSGPLDLDPQGDRTVAGFGLHAYRAGNTFELSRGLQRRG